MLRNAFQTLSFAYAISLAVAFPSSAQEASPRPSPSPTALPTKCVSATPGYAYSSFFAVAADGSIYLAQYTGIVLRYAPGTHGNAMPSATMCLAPYGDQVGDAPSAMAIASDKLYRAGLGNFSEADRFAIGPAESRIVGVPGQPSRTGLWVKDPYLRNHTSNSGVVDSIEYQMGPTDLAVDDTGTAYVLMQANRYYGGCSSSVLVFGSEAAGDVEPSRSFAVDDPGAHPDWQDRPGCPPVLNLAIDAQSRLYYVDLDGNVFVSRPHAAAPNVRIASLAVFTKDHGVRFGPPYTPLALDRNGNVYVGADATVHVLKILPGRTAVDSPLRGSRTRLTQVEDIAIDGKGKLYALNCTASGAASVLVFAPQSTGNVAPLYELGTGPQSKIRCEYFDTTRR